MRLPLNHTAIAIKTVLLSFISYSSLTLANAQPTSLSDIEVITISNQRHNALVDNQSYAQGKTTEADLVNWLSSIPGANINSNGPITGVAQYRGLYGDRIATSLDGHPIIGAGPNAMDTPLSYSTPLIVDSMTVYRGIAPVSAGMSTIGGAIDVKMRKAENMHSQSTQVTGDLQGGYRSNNSASTLSGVVNIANGDAALLLYGNSQTGDSMESGDGTLIEPTDFDKVQGGFDIRHATESNVIGFSAHYTDTTDSGTPALPMDIEYIESHRLSLDGAFSLANWQGEWSLGYLDADHGMTNFLMRVNDDLVLFPLSKYRRNNAVANTTDFKFILNREFNFGELSFGIDGYFAAHDSVITNPNNAMFEVVNFNNVKDDRIAFFTEWQKAFENTTVQFGVRFKHAKANADEISTSMAMMSMSEMPMPEMGGEMEMNNGMNSDMGTAMDNMDDNTSMPMPSMAELASDLQNGFNNINREVSDTNVDLALSTQTQLSDALSLYIGVGVKNRAPSYQERYLWMPMEATGGLADGHTYIGNINLESETAYQSDIGFTYQTAQLMVAPHIFYQKIDDYIQGTPMAMMDMSAKMMAGMMANDDSPLKFSNVDAKLYGADINWYYNINNSVRLSGVASYVRGERQDINDNLYRVAPLNGQMSATYRSDNIITNITFVAVAAQNDVSLTNMEKTTPGYGLINVDVEYFVNNKFTLRGGVDNLFDREYQNHLGGYNRVNNTATPVMQRLPSEGTSAWIEANYSF